ncbi:MAG: ferredoxin family protein [Halanaerobium sp.]
MAENWYPIIDKEKCIKCHNCIDFCPHGVFEVDDEGYPEVVNPLNCVEFCRGCLNACDEGAISYYGDE